MEKKWWIILIIDVILVVLLVLCVYKRYIYQAPSSYVSCHTETKRSCPEKIEECYRKLEKWIEIVEVCPEDWSECYEQRFQTLDLVCPMKSELFWCTQENVEVCE